MNVTGIILAGILGIGILARLTGRLTAAEGRVLATITFNFTLPASGFVALARSNLDQGTLFLPAIGLAVPLILLPIAYIAGRRIPADERVRGVFLSSVTVANLGYFAYPIFQSYFGDTGLSRVALFDVGNAIAAYIVTYTIAHTFGLKNGASGKPILFSIRNLRGIALAPPIWAVVAGTSCSLLSIPIPDVLFNILNTIGDANTPIVMFILASYLKIKITHLNLLALSVGIRMALGFGVGWLLAVLLQLSPFDRFVAATAAGMPVGISVLIYAVNEKLDAEFAATLITLSIIIGLVLIIVAFPLLIASM